MHLIDDEDFETAINWGKLTLFADFFGVFNGAIRGSINFNNI
jgi:hypothetical protein